MILKKLLRIDLLRIQDCNKKPTKENRDFRQALLAEGLNRRAFLKAGSSIAILNTLLACKPSPPQSQKANVADLVFSKAQLQTLDAVQMQLFPSDGDGPSARDLNALGYLQRALQDKKNQRDGDPEFIAKGVSWLDDLSATTLGEVFINLNDEQQQQALKRVAKSSTGRKWLSLLLNYLIQSLTLDPIYGGNPNGIGWQWLEHQAGYPRPEIGKTYRDFD